MSRVNARTKQPEPSRKNPSTKKYTTRRKGTSTECNQMAFGRNPNQSRKPKPVFSVLRPLTPNVIAKFVLQNDPAGKQEWVQSPINKHHKQCPVYIALEKKKAERKEQKHLRNLKKDLTDQEKAAYKAYTKRMVSVFFANFAKKCPSSVAKSFRQSTIISK